MEMPFFSTSLTLLVVKGSPSRMISPESGVSSPISIFMKRRFTGPIFAHQRMNFALPHVQLDVIQGFYSRECFRESRYGKDIRLAGVHYWTNKVRMDLEAV